MTEQTVIKLLPECYECKALRQGQCFRFNDPGLFIDHPVAREGGICKAFIPKEGSKLEPYVREAKPVALRAAEEKEAEVGT